MPIIDTTDSDKKILDRIQELKHDELSPRIHVFLFGVTAYGVRLPCGDPSCPFKHK